MHVRPVFTRDSLYRYAYKLRAADAIVRERRLSDHETREDIVRVFQSITTLQGIEHPLAGLLMLRAHDEERRPAETRSEFERPRFTFLVDDAVHVKVAAMVDRHEEGF